MENYSFKSATFGGFDKQDVMRYIEQSSEKAAAAQQQLEEEKAELQRRLETERAELMQQLEEQVQLADTLQARVKTLTEERNKLQMELDYARNTRQKLEPLQALEAKVKQLTAEADALRPDAEAYARFRVRLGAIECEARKRADDLEVASARQMQKTVDSFRSQYQSLMETFGGAAIHVLGELRKLEMNLTQLPLAMEQTNAELEQLSAHLEKVPENYGEQAAQGQ